MPSDYCSYYYICVPSLVLTAQAVFFLERGQTDRQTDATERPTHAGGYTAGVGNKQQCEWRSTCEISQLLFLSTEMKQTDRQTDRQTDNSVNSVQPARFLSCCF